MTQQSDQNTASSMLNESSTNVIRDLVDQDLTTSLALVHLLEKEQLALQERDHETLRCVLEEKTGLLNTLDAGSMQRAEILTELQQPTSKEAWHQLIDRIGDSDLKERWQSLEDTISECQQCNDVNGKIISRSQQTMSTLINILRGKPQGGDVYGADGGRENNDYNSASLVQA